IGLPGDHIQYINNELHINGEKIQTQYNGKTKDFDISGFVWPVTQKKEKLTDFIEHDIFLRAGFPDRQYKYQDVTVPKDSYFVMGDNRDNSEDSRYWGFVKDKDILGRAFATWMSWDGQHNDVR